MLCWAVGKSNLLLSGNKNKEEKEEVKVTVGFLRVLENHFGSSMKIFANNKHLLISLHWAPLQAFANYLGLPSRLSWKKKKNWKRIKNVKKKT